MGLQVNHKQMKSDIYNSLGIHYIEGDHDQSYKKCSITDNHHLFPWRQLRKTVIYYLFPWRQSQSRYMESIVTHSQ